MYHVATDLPRGTLGIQKVRAAFQQLPGEPHQGGSRWGRETTLYNVLDFQLHRAVLWLLTGTFGGAPLL